VGKMAIFQTISARELIFVPTTPFSYQLSSILELPDTSENWLTQILAPGGPKLVRNGAKWVKWLFSKPLVLGSSFLFILPHFQPG
jgi:hypothetical protein